MDIVSYTAARKSLASVMDKVCTDRVPVAITRKQKPSVVLLPLEDSNSLEETAYLLRSPANARRLFDAVESLARFA